MRSYRRGILVSLIALGIFAAIWGEISRWRVPFTTRKSGGRDAGVMKARPPKDSRGSYEMGGRTFYIVPGGRDA